MRKNRRSESTPIVDPCFSYFFGWASILFDHYVLSCWKFPDVPVIQTKGYWISFTGPNIHASARLLTLWQPLTATSTCRQCSLCINSGTLSLFPLYKRICKSQTSNKATYKNQAQESEFGGKNVRRSTHTQSKAKDT